MKYILLLLLLPLIGDAQTSWFDIPLENGKATYNVIVDVPGVKKDRIFTNIKEWAVSSYKSQKGAIETEDKEAGLLVYKGFFIFEENIRSGIYKGKKRPLEVHNTLKFFVKDEKVKVVITDLATLGVYDYLVANTLKDPAIPLTIEASQVRYSDLLNKKGQKKKAQIEENFMSFTNDIHSQMTVVLRLLENNIKSNKSDFDF